VLKNFIALTVKCFLALEGAHLHKLFFKLQAALSDSWKTEKGSLRVEIQLFVDKIKSFTRANSVGENVQKYILQC